MEAQDLLKKVRKIEIHSRGLSNNIFAGQYHSAFKGRGMAFSEVRAYQYGDDVRDIDWNVTARMNSPYVKVYEEERELTVMLLIDVSASLDFGTRMQTKRDKAKHILYIIHEMLDFHPESKRTDISCALQFLYSAVKHRCTAFILSDFYYRGDYEKQMIVCCKKHDVVAIQLYDQFARELPDVGLIKICDAETSHEMYIDTSDKKLRQAHPQYWQERRASLDRLFSKTNTDNISIATNEDYVKSLIQLFKLRS